MERLTELYISNVPKEVLKELEIKDVPKEDYEIIGTNHDTCKETCEKHNCLDCPIKRAIDKLAEYEDLEEQGLLLKLPCKVGDTVYVLVPMVSKESTYREDIVSRFKIFTDSIWICFKNGLAKDIKQIGKTVFLTEQEAQSALEKMKGE